MARAMTMVALLAKQQLKQGTDVAKNLLSKQVTVARFVELRKIQGLNKFLRPTAHK